MELTGGEVRLDRTGDLHGNNEPERMLDQNRDRAAGMTDDARRGAKQMSHDGVCAPATAADVDRGFVMNLAVNDERLPADVEMVTNDFIGDHISVPGCEGTVDSAKGEEPAFKPDPDAVPKIALNTANAVEVPVGARFQIDLAGQAAKHVQSLHKRVAAVDKSGRVTVKAPGWTEITAEIGFKLFVLRIKVFDPTTPQRFRLLVSGSLTPMIGEMRTITPQFPEGVVSPVKWRTSNPFIATVKEGKVTFKRAGKVTITAICVKGKAQVSAEFKVTK